MARSPTPPPEQPGVERVDLMVDAEGTPVDLPEAEAPGIEEEVEQIVEATPPSSWFGWGMVALGAIVAVLGIMQALATR